MERLSLEDLKRIELELMDELDRICREQGIQYFLAYGSLLGAVRHGGFIPWDDDMDVCMMRSDYERLLEVFDVCKSSERFSLSMCRDGSSIYPFAKIVDNDTVVRERFVEKGRNTGVWVDIFPLERVALGNSRGFRKNQLLFLKRGFAITDSSVGATPFVRLVKKVVCPFFRSVDPVKCAVSIDENARAMNVEDSDVFVDVIGSGDPACAFPEGLFEPMEMDFEGRRYFAPKGYEEFLTIQYGDWRTPPPESEREVHMVEAYYR